MKTCILEGTAQENKMINTEKQSLQPYTAPKHVTNGLNVSSVQINSEIP